MGVINGNTIDNKGTQMTRIGKIYADIKSIFPALRPSADGLREPKDKVAQSR